MADAVTRSLHVSWSQMFCSLDPSRKVPSHPQSLSRKLPQSSPSRTHSIPRTMPFSTKPFALSRALWCTRSRWLWHMSSWLMAHVPCRSDVPCPASQTADLQKDNGNNGEQGSSADGDESSDRSDTTPWSPDHSPPDPQPDVSDGTQSSDSDPQVLSARARCNTRFLLSSPLADGTGPHGHVSWPLACGIWYTPLLHDLVGITWLLRARNHWENFSTMVGESMRSILQAPRPPSHQHRAGARSGKSKASSHEKRVREGPGRALE